LSFLIWIFLSILFSFSFAIVTGIFNPQEKVNAIWLITAAACFYILAYRFYGAFLASKLATLNDTRITPAYRLNDGKNFYPTNKWILFGHHFAAIAGAGPLIGPVLASQFGYLPGFLWILIGAALAGGVHDFIILTGSMRRDGKSLAQIAKEKVGPVTGAAALIAILFILIADRCHRGIRSRRHKLPLLQSLGDIHYRDDHPHCPLYGYLYEIHKTNQNRHDLKHFSY
jgi:carbon starvation protein